jgi:hypothetical protein
MHARLLHLLIGFRDPVLVRAGLNFALTNVVESREFMTLLLAGSLKESAATRFEWLKENYEAVGKRLDAETLGVVAIEMISAGDARLFADGEEFLLDPTRRTPALERVIKARKKELNPLFDRREKYREDLARALSLGLLSGNWPQFRGPNCRGVADDAKPPVQFGPDKALLWKTPLPSGVSSPCIWGDRIFVTGFDETRKQLETLSLDAKSGKVLWRNDATAQELEKVHEASSPANTSPTTDGIRVYVFFPMFGVVAYS